LGTVEIQTYTEAETIREAYRSVLGIERLSWKHEAGSAITSREWESAFYERLITGLSAHNRLQITLAFLDGRPVAHDVGLILGDRYACLKTSFVEKIRTSNPGKVLREFIVASLFEHGYREHDFLGEDEAWKTQWTKSVRQHVHLTIYRSAWRASLVTALRALRQRLPRPGRSLAAAPSAQ
jgi:CelD/BcsL family acetyltransferase involved in cellulose biosynthesis